eukprot:8712590-Ditylum_brightwellii.AAC.1
MPDKEDTNFNTVMPESLRFKEQTYPITNPPDVATKEESIQNSLSEQYNDKDPFIPTVDIRNNDITERDDVDMSELNRHSARTRRSPALFDPGTNPSRNWSLDMVVNQMIQMTNHILMFVILAKYCAFKTTVVSYNFNLLK